MLVKDNVTYEKACEFALSIVKLYQKLIQQNKEFVMSKQLLRAGTSIGANIAEANGAISDIEFSAKFSIAYKEALETKYWLTLLKDSGFIAESDYARVFANAD